MENNFPTLPEHWRYIEADIVYQTEDFRKISFGRRQVRLGIRQDARGKHLRAINIGDVPPVGYQGLVYSELENYDRKTKVLGQGGERRYHGYFTDAGVLYFPGVDTTH